jgi:hypothetical protein
VFFAHYYLMKNFWIQSMHACTYLCM